MDDARRPILVGTGQIVFREQTWPDIAGPLDLLCDAVSLAVADCGTALLSHVDHFCVANIASWDYANAPALAAARLGLDARAELVELPIGGNTPQRAVNDLARRLAAGEIDLAVVAGAEAFAGKRAAKSAGHLVDWGTHLDRVELPPEPRPTHPLERAHGVEAPSMTYPMWEPALRSAAGRTVEEHNKFLGELMARFGEVAVANPYAWFPEQRNPSELLSVTADNRMVATPYPKRLNAIMRVDQGAAVIMTTVGRARELGVPTDRWVYWHGGGDCHDIWYLTERTTYAHSPAMRVVAEQTWKSSGFGIDDVAHIDFYSCFPSAVQLAADAYGVAPDDRRPLTVTGGLAYAGGPGNNYVTHTIATMVNRLRANPGDVGLCTGLGWHVTKHAAGIYSTQPPTADFAPVDPAADQAVINAMPHPRIEMEPRGAATIEAYSVAFDRGGAPEIVRCLARLDVARRTVVSSTEPATVAAFLEGERYGQAITVRPDGHFYWER